MDAVTRTIEVIFVLLILAGVYTAFKYPRDVFVNLPLGIIETFTGRLYRMFRLVTIPVLGPLYLLDKYYRWGIFGTHSGRKKAAKDLPDTEYDVEKKLEIDFQNFDKYIITSAKNSSAIKVSLSEGLATIQVDFNTLELAKHKNLLILKITGIDLYSFHFIVQWMQNEFRGRYNFGFAKKGDFSFFCTCDKSTLNNLLGETSSREIYAYSLANYQNEYLGVNNSIDFRKRYTTKFFNRIIINNQQVTTE